VVDSGFYSEKVVNKEKIWGLKPPKKFREIVDFYKMVKKPLKI